MPWREYSVINRRREIQIRTFLLFSLLLLLWFQARDLSVSTGRPNVSLTSSLLVDFEDFTVLKTVSLVYVMTPHILIGDYQRSGETVCLSGKRRPSISYMR
jgi:hypothetical protein